MHLLMALPSVSGAIAFAAKKAEFLPVEGLRIYFPSGHQTRQEKVGYWLRRLNSDSIDWIKPSVDEWAIDIDGAKERFKAEISKSHPYRDDTIWPSWLNGNVRAIPELEQGDGFKPRLSFFLTELTVAKSKNPTQQSAKSHSVVINNFGGLPMVHDKLMLAITRHREMLSRAARMISAHEHGNALPQDAQYAEDELKELDRFLADCWSEKTGMTPAEAGYVPPVSNAYRSEYYKSDDPIAWLRAFKRSLEQSKSRFESLLTIDGREVHVGDKYEISNTGQIGAVGTNAKVEGNVFSQRWSQLESQVDLDELAAELATLRSELRKSASSVEEDQAVANIGSAENAAKQKDGPSALKFLKAAGQWTLDVATKIGTTVAAKAIENAILK